MNILIVDDSNDKIAKVVSAISSISSEAIIDVSVDTVTAKSLLKSKKYDLMIADLLLPVREKEEVKEDGGKNLVNEIQRNNLLKSPTFILGLTQYESKSNQFPLIWNVLIYDPSRLEWQERLREIIHHIQKEKSTRDFAQNVKKPTVFVEGVSDQKILHKAVELFKPVYQDKIEIRSQKSAGASWVAKQVIIWANTLTKEDGKFLKSIGLLDRDEAGKEARTEVNRVVSNSSAGSSTFKLIDLSPSYAREVINLYQKGIHIPICLEELLPPEYYKLAIDRGWSEERSRMDDFLEDPSNWDKMNRSLKEHIESLEIDDLSKCYLKSVMTRHKHDFIKIILDLPEENLKIALKNFEKLVDDIIGYLFSV